MASRFQIRSEDRGGWWMIELYDSDGLITTLPGKRTEEEARETIKRVKRAVTRYTKTLVMTEADDGS